MTNVLKSIHDSWPFELVARSHVDQFSQGMLHPRTCANRDSARTWNVRKFRVDGKVYYHKADLITYLADQVGMDWNQVKQE